MSMPVSNDNRGVEALKNVFHDKVRKDDAYVQNVVRAHEYLQSVDEHNGNTESVDSNAPDLSMPLGPDGKRLTRSGTLALLMAELLAIIGASSVLDLEAKIAVYKRQMQARGDANQQASDEFDKAEGEASAAVDDYAAKDKVYLSDKSDYEAAQTRKTNAENALNDLKSKGADPNSDEYKSAETELNAATTLVQQKSAALDKSTSAKNAAQQVASDKLKVADACLTKCNSLSKDDNAVINNGKEHYGNLAEMVYLLAEASKTLGDDSNKSLNNDLEIFRAMQKAREQEMDKKADDIQKQEEKSKAMGCIGKVLGFLITVVSVVGAIFTGGATLALAVIGLALMAADEVGKAITGKSFMEAALKPLMDKIIKPLMEKLGKMFADMLMAFGVNKSTAEAVGNAIAAVVVVLVMIAAVSLIGKGAASKMASKMAELVTDRLEKMLPQIVKDLASGMGKGMSQVVQKIKNFMGAGEDLSVEAYALRANKIESYATKAQMALAVGQGVTGAEKGIAEKNKADATADFMVAKAAMEQIKTWIQQSIETFNNSFQGTQDMIATISDYLAKNEETGRFLLRDVKV